MGGNGVMLEDGVDDIDVMMLGFAADVVDLPVFSLFEDEPKSMGVVIDIEPVADMEPITVDGELLALGAAVDHARDEFFRVLVRAIVVRTMGDGRGEAIGDGPSADKVV